MEQSTAWVSGAQNTTHKVLQCNLGEESPVKIGSQSHRTKVQNFILIEPQAVLQRSQTLGGSPDAGHGLYPEPHLRLPSEADNDDVISTNNITTANAQQPSCFPQQLMSIGSAPN